MWVARVGPAGGGFRSVCSAILAVLATACGDASSAERSTIGGELASDLPLEVRVQLDSGNAAYRGGDYEAALGHFGEVVRLDPQLAAGWYGMGMTHMASGNPAAADSAMSRVHELAPEIPLEHPSAPPNPHPIDAAEGGHP